MFGIGLSKSLSLKSILNFALSTPLSKNPIIAPAPRILPIGMGKIPKPSIVLDKIS
jgi:hypothetical protein